MRAELEYRQAQVRLRRLQNQVDIEVPAMRSSRCGRIEPAVQAAQAAVDFARQTLVCRTAETGCRSFQPNGGVARPVWLNHSGVQSPVSAKAAYEKARVELDRATSLLLDHSGIVMADAERGRI